VTGIEDSYKGSKMYLKEAGYPSKSHSRDCFLPLGVQNGTQLSFATCRCGFRRAFLSEPYGIIEIEHKKINGEKIKTIFKAPEGVMVELL